MFTFWPVTKKACRCLPWSAWSALWPLIACEDAGLGGRVTGPGSYGCTGKSLNEEHPFCFSLCASGPTSRRITHSRSRLCFANCHHLHWEEMDPTRSTFLKGEREGKVWNTVTVGVQGGRSGRFGGRVHSKREFIGVANFFNLKCLVFFFFFFLVGGFDSSIYRAFTVC